MRIEERIYMNKGITYSIRSAALRDARALSELRLQVDGETEHMDRERGEAYLSPADFEALIVSDTELPRNLFLVAETSGGLAGYSRVEGSPLKRLEHKAEFGVGVLRSYWGLGVGSRLLERSLEWADDTGIRKIALSVLEENERGIALYRRYGFEVEGVLKQDKKLSDGQYHSTVLMARFAGKSDT